MFLFYKKTQKCPPGNRFCDKIRLFVKKRFFKNKQKQLSFDTSSFSLLFSILFGCFVLGFGREIPWVSILMFLVFSFPLVWPLGFLGAKKLKSVHQAIVFVALRSKVPTRQCFLFTLYIDFINKYD